MWMIIRSWIAGNIISVIGFTGATISVIAILFSARQAGRNAEQLDQLKKIIEVKDAQLRATLDAPRTRDELVDRLRRGKF